MSCSVHVQKYIKNEERGHIEYFIKVFYNGKQWGIWKRYSEFLLLHEYLHRDGNICDYKLPERDWWNRFDPNILNRRLKELQSYLDILFNSTMSPEDSLIIKEFLEVDFKMLEIAKMQSYCEMNRAQKMLQVLKDSKHMFIRIPRLQSQHKSKRRNSSFNRAPSFGSSISNSFLPNGSNLSGILFNSGFSIGSVTTPPTNLNIPLASMSSYSLDLWTSSGSNANLSTASLLDIKRYENFVERVELRWPEISDRVSYIVKKSRRKWLPIPLCKSSHEISNILSEPILLNQMLSELLSKDMNVIIEASPNIILKLITETIIRRLETPLFTNTSKPNTNNSDSNFRCLALSKDKREEDDVSSRVKVELRLRKTPTK